jgi:hypothetical protein
MAMSLHTLVELDNQASKLTLIEDTETIDRTAQ